MKLKRNKATLLLTLVLFFSLMFTACAEKTEVNNDSQLDQNDQQNESQSDESQSEDDTGNNLAEEQILRVNINRNPSNLDAQTSLDGGALVIMNAYLEGLVRIGEDGKISKGSGLAEDWDVSEDGLKYTFYLRDSKWSDGTPVTAHDFEYAWKRALNPETGSPFASEFYLFKNGKKYNKQSDTNITIDDVGIKAESEKILKVELEKCNEDFLFMLSIGYMLPVQKDAIEKYGDAYGTSVDTLPASGPFVITEWKEDQQLVLEKNEYYWDSENVKLQKIICDMIDDSNTEMSLYETGEIDTIKLPNEFLDQYRDTPDLVISPADSVTQIVFNNENEIFSNKKIRKAFSIAVNRQEYVDNILNDGTIAAYSCIMPGVFRGIDNGEFITQSKVKLYDVGTDGDKAKQEAQQLLEEGLNEIGMSKQDIEDKVSILIDNGASSIKSAEVFQEMWKQNLGVLIQVEPVQSSIKWDKFFSGDYTLGISGNGLTIPSPYSLLEFYTMGHPYNDPHYSNSEFDKLIEKAYNSIGNEKAQACLDAEEILLSDVAISPTYFPVGINLQKPYVKGLVRNLCGVDLEFKYVRILKH